MAEQTGKIETVSDLETVVNGFEKSLSQPGRSYPPIWYRGEANKDWELQPAALRPLFQEEAKQRGNVESINRSETFEMSVLAHFRRMAASQLPRGVSATELYYIAQHHGLPTRLLDWTTNPLIALFFAVSSHPKKDGKLYAINANYVWPLDVNMHCVLSSDHHKIADTCEYLVNAADKRCETGEVLPVLPDPVWGRMVNQSSCFTLHMPGCPSLKTILDQNNHMEFKSSQTMVCEEYVVPIAKKEPLQVCLRRMGIHYGSIFGDLDNVAKEICCAYGINKAESATRIATETEEYRHAEETNPNR